MSIYKMNYHTDIVSFRGSLSDRGAYLKILLSGGTLIRSFTVVQNDKSVYNIIQVAN